MAKLFIHDERVGKPPGARVTTNRHIRIRPIRKIGSPSPLWLQLLWTPYKAILLGLQLFWVMACVSQKPDFIIVQVNYECWCDCSINMVIVRIVLLYLHLYLVN